tara:strand:+ start:10293 stop:11312 length:1020 start_codon:yes stop_codon:yes gene_type:complete
MPQTRKKLIKKFINEGFTHRTLSLFSDKQLKELSKKVFKEEVSDEQVVNAKEILKQAYTDKLKQLETNEEDETEEERNIETDPTGNPDVKIDGEDLLVELPKEVEEDFASKAQQKYLYAVNPAAAEKLASKMTKKDYEKLPEKVNEQKILENWILSLVESKQIPEITKANFLKTIKENLGCGDTVSDPYTIGTPAQQESFDAVMEIASEIEPMMDVKVDGFDDDGHLNGYLSAPEEDKIISLNICPIGNIKLDGMTLGERELSETDRDDEGEYVGAPEATTAPPPLKTPTIAPSKPGEKKRRGPFERPKTTPKPKAKNKNALPDWLTSTNLGKALTQHG